MLAVPGLCLAFVVWAVASRRLPAGLRRVRRWWRPSWWRALAGRWSGPVASRELRQRSRLAVDADARGAAACAGRRSLSRQPAAVAATATPAAAPSIGSVGPLAAERATGTCDIAERGAPPTPRGDELDDPAIARTTGPDFAAAIATASFAACGSTPTGRRRRRSSCGAGRSARAGRRSRCMATCFYTQEQRGDDEIVAAYRREHRRAGVETSRRGALLGVERRRRPARRRRPSATAACTRLAQPAS